MRIELNVNGEQCEADVWEGESLLYALRERLGLPGSKNACEQGECGSCSVLLDGKLVCACLVLAAQGGCQVRGCEGGKGGGLRARGADALAALLWGVWLHGEAGAVDGLQACEIEDDARTACLDQIVDVSLDIGGMQKIDIAVDVEYNHPALQDSRFHDRTPQYVTNFMD